MVCPDKRAARPSFEIAPLQAAGAVLRGVSGGMLWTRACQVSELGRRQVEAVGRGNPASLRISAQYLAEVERVPLRSERKERRREGSVGRVR